MASFSFILPGIAALLYLLDIYQAKNLVQNIAKRAFILISGILILSISERDYLQFTRQALWWGILPGMFFFVTHLIIAGGVKLRKDELNRGLVFSCLLIYLLELPAEEFLYRGVILITLLYAFGLPFVAILISSMLFRNAY